MEQPYLQQFVDNLVEIVHKHPVTIDIFGGLPPFTNAPLKKLASAGSYFFDQVYAQLASLLQVQTTTKQNLVAPNDAFTEIYDLFMYSISPDSPLYQHSDQYRNRHWNNKGNSLEALSLILAEKDITHWFGLWPGYVSNSPIKINLTPLSTRMLPADQGGYR